MSLGLLLLLIVAPFIIGGLVILWRMPSQAEVDAAWDQMWERDPKRAAEVCRMLFGPPEDTKP